MDLSFNRCLKPGIERIGAACGWAGAQRRAGGQDRIYAEIGAIRSDVLATPVAGLEGLVDRMILAANECDTHGGRFDRIDEALRPALALAGINIEEWVNDPAFYTASRRNAQRQSHCGLGTTKPGPPFPWEPAVSAGVVLRAPNRLSRGPIETPLP